MNKMVNVFVKSTIITSLFLLALGILLIVKSEATILMVSYVIGAVLIALGVLAVINFLKSKSELYHLDIVYGIVTIILGILVIKNPTVIGSIIPFVVGVGILINSGTKLKYALDLRENNEEVWKYTLLVAIISAILGVLLLFNPFKASSLLVQAIGIVISIYAVLDIVSTIILKRRFNKSSEIKEADIKMIEDEKKDKKTKKNKKSQKTQKVIEEPKEEKTDSEESEENKEEGEIDD